MEELNWLALAFNFLSFYFQACIPAFLQERVALWALYQRLPHFLKVNSFYGIRYQKTALIKSMI